MPGDFSTRIHAVKLHLRPGGSLSALPTLPYLLLHQSVPVAVKIKISAAPKIHSCFGVPLRVKLHNLNPVACRKSRKRDVVLFRHTVVDCDEAFIFDRFNLYFVLAVSFRCFKRRQGDSAAADQCVTVRIYHISANRTNIKLRTKKIRRNIVVRDLFPLHQLRNRNTECRRQRLDQRDIRQSFCGFPL